jgi:tetratricopeptide (TPR) repeat protein
MDYRQAVWETVEYLRSKTTLALHAEIVVSLWKVKGYTEEEIKELTRLLAINDIAYSNEFNPSEFRLGLAGTKLNFDQLKPDGNLSARRLKRRRKTILWIGLSCVVAAGFILFFLSLFNHSSTLALEKGKKYLDAYKKEFKKNLATHSDTTDEHERLNLASMETPPVGLLDATHAFLRCEELDSRKIHAYECSLELDVCHYYLVRAGFARLKRKLFNESMSLYELAIQIEISEGKIDTTSIRSLAAAEHKAKLYDKAIDHYNMLIRMGYEEELMRLFLSRVYRDAGNKEKCLSTLAGGLEKYPENSDLLIEEVNFQINQGNISSAFDRVKKNIDNDPDNAESNFVAADVYDRVANPFEENGKALPKPINYEALCDQAIFYYKRSIELNPGNTTQKNIFGAHYRLGTLYYNRYCEYFANSKDVKKDTTMYKILAPQSLKEAKKYLETANTLAPGNETILKSLMNVYKYLGEDDNYVRMVEEVSDAKRKALK